jgi:hypothetical protein
MTPRCNSSILQNIFLEPEQIVSVFVKKLSRNDNASKHGVLVPVETYPMFPSFVDFDQDEEINYTDDILTIWKIGDEPVETKESKFKHYHRYPERRITRLKSEISDLEDGSIMIIGKRRDIDAAYEIHYITPSEDNYSDVVTGLSIDLNVPSSYFSDLCWGEGEELSESGIDIFLTKFDEIKAMGFVETMRGGDTGIGYTFETLMGIEENNYSGPDFEGIELKCYSLGRGEGAKKNLFLKEPKWIDDLGNMVARVEEYGYYDDENERNALYSSVTSKTNSHGLKLRVSRREEKVFLNFEGSDIAYWQFSDLEGRLIEKLSEAVFIGTKVKKIRSKIHYQYETITHCSTPFIDSFINIIESKNIIVELRMHVNEKGSVRNHGTGFRTSEKQFPELYAKVQKLR